MLPIGLVSSLERQGYALYDRFITPRQCDELMQDLRKLIEATPASELNTDTHHWEKGSGALQNADHDPNRYFLLSGDGVGFFKRQGAGPLRDNATVADKLNAVGRVGYGLHIHRDVFKRVAFSEKSKALASGMGFRRPVVVQSQVITDECTKHQDLTYLYVEPPSNLYMVWVALTDQCILKVVPGSHKQGLVDQNRFVRKTPGPITNTRNVELGYTGPSQLLSKVLEADFKPVTIPKGSALIVHSLMIYKTDKSSAPSPWQQNGAFCFHVAESHDVEWDARNFLQPTHGPFMSLMETKLENPENVV